MPLCPPFSKQCYFCFKKKKKALRHALTSHSAELKRSHKYNGIDREEMKSLRWLGRDLGAQRKVWVPHVLLELDEPCTRFRSVTLNPTLKFVLGCE